MVKILDILTTEKRLAVGKKVIMRFCLESETGIDRNRSKTEKMNMLNGKNRRQHREIHVLFLFLPSARAPSSLTEC